MKHEGNLQILTVGDALKYRDVTDVDGDLNINADAARVLTTVGGDLHINVDADLPSLTNVGGYLNIYADADLPVLTTVGGDLRIYADTDLPVLTTVGGHLNINAYADLPVLTTVGGDLRIYADTPLPALTTAHGVKGRLLCASTYGLWLGDNGLLYAGCHEGLTIDEALKHWDRTDERAVMFTAAIKKLNESKI
jgi:hypothetical protein